MSGAKLHTEAVGSSGKEIGSCDGRGAFHTGGSMTVRTCGRYGSENAGMSSEKASENLARRKPKVS